MKSTIRLHQHVKSTMRLNQNTILDISHQLPLQKTSSQAKENKKNKVTDDLRLHQPWKFTMTLHQHVKLTMRLHQNVILDISQLPLHKNHQSAQAKVQRTNQKKAKNCLGCHKNVKSTLRLDINHQFSLQKNLQSSQPKETAKETNQNKAKDSLRLPHNVLVRL